MNQPAFKLIFAFLVSLVFLTPFAGAQTASNVGTEFWTVFPTHVPDFDKNFQISFANMSIFITGASASSGTVTAGGFSQAFKVSPDAVTEIPIPRANAYINDVESGTVLPGRAIHILVDSGKPAVVVYAHIFAGQRSAASLVLPKNGLGQQYYSMNYPEHAGEGQNFIAVVATEAATRIRLKKNGIDLVPGGILLNNVNDTYEYLADQDLSGVSVSVDSVTSGCNRFAVFSGSSAVYIPTNGCEPGSIDPLFQQCYPVDSWGETYGFIPFSMQSPNVKSPVRTAGQYARVVAKDNGTIVTINGATVATLNAGQFYTSPVPINVPAYISANKAISVAQYALTQSCSNLNQLIKDTLSGYSDPDMVILNPIAYNIKHITVYSSKKENITEQYINVLIKTDAAATFKVNGAAPAASFLPMATLPGYSYLRLNLNGYTTQTFTLDAGDGFNAIAYGFGNVESYAYSAGTNLSSPYAIMAVNTATQLTIDSSCIETAYLFRLTLPYLSPQISWKMDAAETATDQLNPVPTVMTKNGKTSYLYSFPKTAAYQHPGNHAIKIRADYPNTIGGCNTGSQQIEYSFYVIPPPKVIFSAVPESCEQVIDFKDLSTDTAGIFSRLWDFGETASGINNTDTAKNTAHDYTDSGTYRVRLTVTSASGCQSTRIDTLHIYRKIQLAFSVSAPACIGSAIFFNDESYTRNFEPAAWKWYFGNGDSVILNSRNPASYRYAIPGTYTVKLVLTNALGCSSDTLAKTITIRAKPAANFSVPGICVTDQAALFTDLTPGPGSRQGPNTYRWGFGDPNASPENPDSAATQNPVHRFTAAGRYLVSETVITADGCDTTITKPFLVNGATPKAAFDVLNTGRICSGQPIILKNKSTVDFGNITRLEWYFDARNHPADKLIITAFSPDSLYAYIFPALYSPTDTISCTIKLLAYSGSSCVDSTTRQVTLWSVPTVRFDTLKTICLSSAPIQLDEARETTGITGQGSYRGPGVSAAGWFDPAAAGIGNHLITYQFTSLQGCTDSASRQIRVVPEPAVNLKEQAYVDLGRSFTIEPVYGGSNLTYKWTPATWLNNDTAASPIIFPEEDISYTVAVSNSFCTTSATIRIHVLRPPVIYNTFTPNGDGINDVWTIRYLNDYPKATVDILNRYGALIFHSVGYSKPWDGRFQGATVPSGTYYYIIDLKNGQKNLSGFVVLIR